jgi:hypothetical protein
MQAQKQNLFFLLCIVLAFTFSAIAEVTIPLVRIPTSPSHKRGKIPLGGGILSDGEYYANISVGSPAKYFTLQVIQEALICSSFQPDVLDVVHKLPLSLIPIKSNNHK